MSERRTTVTLAATFFSRFFLIVASALTLAASDAGAQVSLSTAELRARTDSMQVRARAADSAYRRALRQRRGAAAETLVVAVHGFKIVATEGMLSARERKVLAEDVRKAFTTLARDFGAESVALVDTTTPWRVRESRGTLGMLRTLRINGVSSNTQVNIQMSRPLSGGRLTAVILALAGAQLPRLVPALESYAGANASFAGDDDRFEMVARELALTDWAVASGCLRGGDPDRCRQALMPATPLSMLVRGSFVTHALDVGGPQMIARLSADTTSDAITLLSRGAQLPADSLIAGWRRRTVAALERSRPPAGALVVSTAAWGLLLLGLATSRKPS